MDIIIDTKGEEDLRTKDHLVDSDDDDFEFGDNGTPSNNIFDIEESLLSDEKPKKASKANKSKDIDLEKFEEDMGWINVGKRRRKRIPNVHDITKEVTAVDKLLKKSVIQPGFEQLEAVPPYDNSARRYQAERRKERAETKGDKWFNMRPPELTPEVKHDLEVLKMRSALDPKRFYKKNDLKVLPKYFQIGKIVDSPLDYYSGRVTKKDRKQTIVEELMADAEFSKYNKRKYKEIIDEKKKLHYKAHKHAKRLKGRRK